MGLFDNLFLDQNTPITINDGLDHSKDVALPVVDPTTSSTSQPGTGSGTTSGDPKDDTKDGKKKDDTISDLFDADKKEEKAADAVLAPEPPTDIALQIGMTPVNENAIPPLDPSMAAPSFDIGGDISFDTLPESNIVFEESQNAAPLSSGGDAGTLSLSDASIAASTPSAPLPADAAPSFLGGAPSVAATSPNTGTIALTGSAPAGDNGLATPSLPLGAPVENSSPAEASIPSSDPTGGIFGLLGSDTPVGVPADPSSLPPANASPPITTPVGVPSNPNEANNLGLGTPLGTGAGGTLPSRIPDMPPSSLSGTSFESTTGGASFGYPEGEGSRGEALLGRDALALFTQGTQTSGILRDKLTNFIDELKTLHSRDQSQRYHKLEQIAMYEERIREIDAEAATRKRVLQAEIEDLKRQIEMMDREKNDIQEVISTFHKEMGRG